ncbi:hypothetical protein GQ53DRAFT_807370 [Thozetella sp. PMI_491]|nr:hypothetical protein GQ53DRAFT_807370 [Thozetella sp. PMI_491]
MGVAAPRRQANPGRDNEQPAPGRSQRTSSTQKLGEPPNTKTYQGRACSVYFRAPDLIRQRRLWGNCRAIATSDNIRRAIKLRAKGGTYNLQPRRLHTSWPLVLLEKKKHVKMRGLITLMLSAAALAADCTRESLKAGTDALLAAQTAGDPSLLKPVAASLAYSENFKAATLATGALATAMKIDHSRSSLDTTQCATFTEIIVSTGAKPAVIGVQMRWTGDSISKIETLVTAQGDWLFNVTGTLYWASREDWGTIPEGKRDDRKTIQAAADAYCDIFSDKSVQVPWGHPCARLEGGSYTGNGGANDKCDVGIPSGVSLTDRRYVIDETVGAVDIMMSFANIPDSHEFRVEGGKLRFVHTMTVMTARGGGSSTGKGKGKGKGTAATRSIQKELHA